MFLMGKFGKNLKKVYNMAVQKSQKGCFSRMFLMGKFGKNLKKVYNMAVQKSQKGADNIASFKKRR